MNYNKKPLNIALTLALLSMTNTVSAQEDKTKGTLEVIEVTAQKRVQNLQELPTAVSVFNSESINDKGITDIEDLSIYTPNMQISETPGGSTGATIAIRGSVTINPAVTWEPTTGVYIDGVFVSKNVGGLFDVAAIDRVEVLRGPQGTLYGKNTIGGALNILTRKPSGEFGGEMRVGAGNYGMTDIYITADSAQINDNLSFNITANKKDRDGFYDNLSVNSDVKKFKELESTSLRFGALYEYSDALEFYYTYDNSDKDLTPSMGQVNIAGLMPDDSKSRQESAALDGVQFDRSESSGHALTVTWESSDNLTIKSISAFREIDYEDGSDYDGFDLVGFHTFRRVDHEQTSQEIQFIGNQDKLNYVAGLFYMKEESNVDNPFILGFGTVNNYYGVEADSIAAYTHLDYQLTDKLTIAGGVRWTTEDKSFYIEHPDDFSMYYFFPLPHTTASDTWENTSAMASLNYELADNVQTYVKVSQGWKAGGFNGEAPNSEIAVKPYDEEKVLAYEWGLKSRWLDQRVQANIAVFYNDITDMQMSEFLGAYSDIQNAGAAKVKGIELELVAALTDELTANFSYGMLDGEYDEFVTYNVYTGAPNDITDSAVFPYSPDNKWSLGLNYASEFDIGNLSVSADYSYVDDHYAFHNQPAADLTSIEGYSVINARISLKEIAGSQFSLSVWGKNITDEEYRINGVPMGDATGAFIGGINYYGDPVTYGGEVSYAF
ncbi:MAG: TonB-dependent receptor [Thalassotalea sp.]|nr:TonB-dependent receptor [Thalassotalea sp.]MDG2392759.1 TonB-dependent receptor [Thalassotalea sp.]